MLCKIAKSTIRGGKQRELHSPRINTAIGDIEQKGMNPSCGATHKTMETKHEIIDKAAKHKLHFRQPVMILRLTSTNAPSKMARVLGCIMARTELGIMFARLSGNSSHLIWSVNPTQKYLTPSVQLLGVLEPIALSMVVAALETAL
jgi:hypothetical protein